MGSGNDSNSCDSLLQDPFEEPDNLFPKYYIDDSSSSVHDCSSQQDMFEDSNSIDEKEKSTKLNKKISFHSSPIPAVAVQEKIIFCIDNTLDKGVSYTYMDMEQKTGESSPSCVRNEALRVFITNKLAISQNTEFAIASVEPGKVEWLSIMSSDIQHLRNKLSGLKSECEETATEFDVTPIFSNVLSLLSLPEQNSFKVIPPSYIIRVIFVYCNSFKEPKLNASDASYLKFMTSPSCVLDVLYLHEKQSDFNNVEKIFQILGKITSPSSYLLESSRNVVNVFKNTAKLLAHPYQRVNQQMWNY